MSRTLSLLFGTGWWVLWYGFLWSWLLPAAYFCWWLGWVLVPGAGPQGGEAMVALMLLTFMGLGVATVVDALLLGIAVEGPRWLRLVALPLGAVWLVLLVLVVLMALIEAFADDGPAAAAAVLAAVAGIIVLNLWALARCRPR